MVRLPGAVNDMAIPVHKNPPHKVLHFKQFRSGQHIAGTGAAAW